MTLGSLPAPKMTRTIARMISISVMPKPMGPLLSVIAPLSWPLAAPSASGGD